MQYIISGDNLQMVTLTLADGEQVSAEAGAMVNMSGNMRMESAVVGGLFKGLKRMMTGESFFLSQFTPAGGSGQVAFAGNVPGQIFPIVLNGNEFVAQQDAYLCAEKGVDLDIAFTKKIRAGLFGGEGFVLQRLSGHGTAFLHCCGDIVEMTLAPDQVMKVQTGLVVGFESTVRYDIARAGGISTILFGGEGLFLTTLQGPGKVVLQSMDVAKLARALSPFIPHPEGGSH